jgi:hypothetical protein
VGSYPEWYCLQNRVVAEVKKRYWFHIVFSRDLVSRQVDLLGTQLEEVVE